MRNDFSRFRVPADEISIQPNRQSRPANPSYPNKGRGEFFGSDAGRPPDRTAVRLSQYLEYNPKSAILSLHRGQVGVQENMPAGFENSSGLLQETGQKGVIAPGILCGTFLLGHTECPEVWRRRQDQPDRVIAQGNFFCPAL